MRTLSAAGTIIDLLILGALPLEIRTLADDLRHSQSLDIAGTRVVLGSLGTRRVLVGTTGLGKVNAAMVTTAILARWSVAQAWNVGTAGTFDPSILAVGDVLIADELMFGDEGVITRSGIQSTAAIGIPLWEKGTVSYHDSLPLHGEALLQAVQARLPPAEYAAMGPLGRSPDPFRLVYGPSLTVGMASGDRWIGRRRALRYGALAENMEGSAVGRVCSRYSVPFVECRGISNVAGNRRKAHWQLDKALAHCQIIVKHWVQSMT